MTYIVPFEKEFAGVVQTVYSVNNDDPEAFGSNVTTKESCPHCGESHVFKLFEPFQEWEEDNSSFEKFDSKCPACRKGFNITIEYNF